MSFIVVLALVAAGVTYYSYRRARPKSPAARQLPERSQRTLLLQIPAAGGEALASVLFVTDPATGIASMVLVPSRVLSQVPGYGSALFGEALKFGGAQLSADTVANQVGVIVDGTWLLSLGGLAALVDSVGGIDVVVDVALPGGKDSSDVVLDQGQQHLGGQAAAAFATYSVAGQPELGRLTRLQLVLTAVLDVLPKTTTEIMSKLPLPEGESSGAPRTIEAESLRLLAVAKVAQKLFYKVVPVTDVDSGSDEETTRIDPAQLAELVTSTLAASVPANEFRPDNRVVVRNGVGTAGVGQTVTRRLNAAGFSVVQTGNADKFDYQRTQVLIFDSSDRSVGRGEAVAAALGLPADDVEVSDVEQSVAEVIVTVGADYAPVGSASPGSPAQSVGP